MTTENEVARVAEARTPAPRRVFTAPELPTAHRFRSAQAGDGLVETLFSHPAVKIVSFTAGAHSIPLSPGRGSMAPVELESGSLEWSSQLERTIAVGPFRIYRAPGSVAFLSCGSALQPILPKSQCWCVDELSTKYVLQIRRPQYWRIEVPAVDAEDAQPTRVLRDVFDQIMQFEKTPCPFKRSFTVDLPERPKTPLKKRPWTPVRRPSSTMPPTPVTPLELRDRRPSLPARTLLDSLHRTPELKVEGLRHPGAINNVKNVARGASSITSLQTERPAVDAAMDGFETREQAQPAIPPPSDSIFLLDSVHNAPAIPPRFGSFQSSRAATAPPQLTLVTSPPSKSSEKPSEKLVSEKSSEKSSPTGSSDSFHTVESWHSPITPLPPSPPPSDPSSPETFPYPHENILYPKRSAHHRDRSDITVTADTQMSPRPLSTPGADSAVQSATTSLSPGPPSPALESVTETKSESARDVAETTSPRAASPATAAATTQPTPYRHRATTSSISMGRRALSPLPPAVNLITPQRQKPAGNKSPRPRVDAGRLAVMRRMPMAVLHKTCEILLSPPGHLVSLMLRVAARIAAGEWRGFVAGTGDKGEAIPVRWDYSSDGEASEEGWEGGRRRASEDWGAGSAEETASAAARPGQTVGEAGRDRPQSKDNGARRAEEPRHNIVEEADDAAEDAEWSRSWGVD